MDEDGYVGLIKLASFYTLGIVRLMLNICQVAVNEHTIVSSTAQGGVYHGHLVLCGVALIHPLLIEDW